MIYNDLQSGEFVSLLALGFICAVIFLINGIIVLVTKNTSLISKDTQYKNPELFAKIYGWVTVSFSSLMLVIMAIVCFKNNLKLTMFLILGITVITMLLIQIMLQKKFRVKK